MRAVHIVVDPPFFDAVASMPIAGEELHVGALIAQPTVGTLHEAVLHRFTRRDVAPFDMPVFLPHQDGIRGQLGAVAPPEGMSRGR